MNQKVELRELRIQYPALFNFQQVVTFDDAIDDLINLLLELNFADKWLEYKFFTRRL